MSDSERLSSSSKNTEHLFLDAEMPIDEAPEDATKAPEFDGVDSGSATAGTVTNVSASPEAELWLTYEEIIQIAKICVSTHFGYLRERGPRRERTS
ncbi:hypothetical protein BJ912DRAFT_1055310 [Pholiota molesta]|nr:hypothetical protein BJ912DRAFT_1055310 [Pholiota molesta]